MADLRAHAASVAKNGKKRGSSMSGLRCFGIRSGFQTGAPCAPGSELLDVRNAIDAVRLLQQHRRDCLRRSRRAEIVALHGIATTRTQEIPLLPRFHAFGRNLEI